MDWFKPGSLSTYLEGRPRLPGVEAMSPHSEKMAPLWTNSSNLGREKGYVRTFPNCSSATLHSSAPTSTPYPFFGMATPSEEEDA